MSRRPVPFALAALGGLLLQGTGGGVILDGLVLDAAQRARSAVAVRPVYPDVAIVGVDAETLEPAPPDEWRRRYAVLLGALDAAGAEAAGFVPPLPGLEAGQVVEPPFSRNAPVAAGGSAARLSRAPVALPLDPGEQARRLPAARVDGRAPLVRRLAGTMGVQADEGWIDYGLGRSFDYDRLDSVLRWASEGNVEALERKLRGRPVLIGRLDRAAPRAGTPVPLAGWEPGARDSPRLLVQAQALRTLLAGRALRPTPAWLVASIVLLAAGSAALAERLLLAGLALSGAALLLWRAELMLLEQGSWLPPSGVIAAALLGVALAASRERARAASLAERGRELDTA